MTASTTQSHTEPTTTVEYANSVNIPPEGVPRHIAIIMDGNGRWAQQRGKDRTYGHRFGAETVRTVVTECGKLGVEALTLYSFSTENWRRSADEVDTLMQLYVEYLVKERDELHRNNVRFIQIGQRDGLPDEVLEQLDQTVASTAENTGLTLCLALNYGSRSEIAEAARRIAQKVQTGEMQPEQITPDTLAAHLYTAGLPDPDLLIRTAGERRLSNYLLWQISYAEFYVDEVCWPDFDQAHFHEAIRDFARRKRKFGGVK
jgi:undecaprenyl diphosphate synthase